MKLLTASQAPLFRLTVARLTTLPLRPTGARAMWVERRAAAPRNPEPNKYQVIKQPSKQVLKAKREWAC